MTTESILEEAQRLIHGERAEQYGDVSENFQRIAKLWGAYRGQYFDRHDVAMMMALVKIARLSSGYHRDSVVDIAGYAALAEKVHIPVPVGRLTDVEKGLLDKALQGVAPPSDPETRYRGNRPRIWNFPSDIPNGVVATDKDGDFWEGLESSYRFRSRREGGQWGEAMSTPEDFGEYAPFTEVLDG